jgi:predicted ArsR family transcriptional regulator
MRKPIYIRPLTATEQYTLQEGLRSSNAFMVRRCQILLASASGQYARVIAASVGCNDQTVRNVIKAFNARGLAAVQRRSSAPHRRPYTIITPSRRQQLQALLHQSPRTFGKPTSVWTLDLAAEVAYATGILPRRVSGEAIRQTLARRKVRWKRAKHWITSPDPASASTRPVTATSPA